MASDLPGQAERAHATEAFSALTAESPGSIATELIPRYPQVVSLLERIVIDPEVVHGRPAVHGTRMRVTDVLSLLAAGASEAEILDDYPYLTADDIRACLEYASTRADHAVLLAS